MLYEALVDLIGPVPVGFEPLLYVCCVPVLLWLLNSVFSILTANVCIGFVSTWELSGTTLKDAALKSLMAGTASNSCFFINNFLYLIVFFAPENPYAVFLRFYLKVKIRLYIKLHIV